MFVNNDDGLFVVNSVSKKKSKVKGTLTLKFMDPV